MQSEYLRAKHIFMYLTKLSSISSKLLFFNQSSTTKTLYMLCECQCWTPYLNTKQQQTPSNFPVPFKYPIFQLQNVFLNWHLYKQNRSPELGRRLLSEYPFQLALRFDRCFDMEKQLQYLLGSTALESEPQILECSLSSSSSDWSGQAASNH